MMNTIISGKAPSIEKPYGPYPLFVTNAKNKRVPILQVYANSKYVGKVHLHFDTKGDLVTIVGSPTLLNKDIGQGTIDNEVYFCNVIRNFFF